MVQGDTMLESVFVFYHKTEVSALLDVMLVLIYYLVGDRSLLTNFTGPYIVDDRIVLEPPTFPPQPPSFSYICVQRAICGI